MSLKSLIGVPPVYLVLLLPILTAVAFVYLHRRNAGRSVVRRLTHTSVPTDDQGQPLGPAETGFLLDHQLDGRDVTAAVFSLAVRGHLRIRVRREVVTVADSVVERVEYRLSGTGKEDFALTEFERRLMGYLLEGPAEEGSRLLQTKGWRERIEALEETLIRRLVDLGYYPASPRRIRRRYRFAGGALFGFLYLLLDPDFDLLRLFFGRDPELSVYVAFVAAIGLTGLIFFAAARFMPQRTWKGGAVLAQIEGFRRFLASAGKGAFSGSGSPSAGTFETCLPYAVAFGLTDRWLSAFEGIRSDPPPWFTAGDDPAGSPWDGGIGEIGRAAAGLEAIFGKESGTIREGAEILNLFSSVIRRPSPRG